MTTDTSPRRSGGRDARRAARLHAHVAREPFLTRTLAPVEVLGDEGLSIIEDNADTILQEVGLEFRGDADALRLLKDAGADVQGERVRFPKGMCRQIVQASAPEVFTQYARNEANHVRSAAVPPSSPRTTARRSSATSTTAGGTARSRTSGIS